MSRYLKTGSRYDKSLREYVATDPYVEISSDEVVTRWALPIIVAIAVMVGSAWAYADGGLHNDSERSGPPPAGAKVLAPDLYLLDKNASITASDLCGVGTNSSGDSFVERNIRLDGLNADLVDCLNEMKWNVHKGPDQSFGEGIVSTATAPWYWGLLAGLAFLAMPWAYFYQLARQSGRKKVAAKVARKALERQRELLVAQWAKNGQLELDDPAYIADDDFERRLGQIDAKIAQS